MKILACIVCCDGDSDDGRRALTLARKRPHRAKAFCHKDVGAESPGLHWHGAEGRNSTSQLLAFTPIRLVVPWFNSIAKLRLIIGLDTGREIWCHGCPVEICWPPNRPFERELMA